LKLVVAVNLQQSFARDDLEQNHSNRKYVLLLTELKITRFVFAEALRGCVRKSKAGTVF
jgi:hypothetical protein